MSLPKIPDINPDINITREDSVNILIASVGLEEMALAHILNAEGEKIQYILGTLDGTTAPTDVTVCDVMKINDSVNKTMKSVIANEMLLLFKLENAIGLDGSEECRKNLTITKIWNDGNNAHNTRPVSVEITLLRDGEVHDTAMLTAAGNWKHTFKCLPVGNDSKQYEYTIDETIVPDGYSKSVSGYNVTNTLNTITINGSKIWDDNHNAAGKRPATILIHYYLNGHRNATLYVPSPPAGEDISQFTFNNVPFADAQGNPYVITVNESDIDGYRGTVNGFDITNTLITGGFSFTKTSTVTGLNLQGAVFEIRQNGALIYSSESDAAGRVSFSGLLPGAYQMAETVPPVGYMDNPTVYIVVVDSFGSVTIDGIPANQFSVRNTPKPDEIILRRATSVVPDYMVAPNTWPLHGAIEPDLYMLDKILITLPRPAVLVKWAYGIQDAAYFRAGGGTDITATYTNGIFPWQNSDYTVYAMFSDGTDAVASITIDRLRDGSEEMPYLLIDFSTADALESSIRGIDQFTLNYMQGNGVKLTQHYEIYEDIDMEGKTWEPLGPMDMSELFTGSLYGNKHSIANLTVGNLIAGAYSGLFRFIGDGAKIQSLNLVNCSTESINIAAGFAAYVWVKNGGTVLLKDLRFDGVLKSALYRGGITGTAAVNDGSLIIEGCIVDFIMNETEHSGYYSAGIIANCVAGANGSLFIAGCYAYGNISFEENCAGIIGLLDINGSAEIFDCLNAMTLERPENAGGIAAIAKGSGRVSISSCCNKGDISSMVAGGIIGTADGQSLDFKILNCYNNGKINANSFSGGIYGINRGISDTQNCYNTGDVISSAQNASAHSGGISGNYGNIANCAASGKTVSSFYETARISPSIDYSTQSVLNNNVAFDNMQVLINGVQKFPLDTGSAGTDGISVTSATLKAQALYENTLGWDFTNIWSFGNGAYTLPILRNIPASLQPDVLPPHLA